jgi:hypothetical protein
MPALHLRARSNLQRDVVAGLEVDCLFWLCADLLQIIVWVTPAGTVDEGGKEQPAYLNFDVALLGPPTNNEMQVCAFSPLLSSPLSLHPLSFPVPCKLPAVRPAAQRCKVPCICCSSVAEVVP